jgi:two-component system, NtrC family, response regulator AtoC
VIVAVGDDASTTHVLRDLAHERGFRWREIVDADVDCGTYASRAPADVMFLLDDAALRHRQELRPLAQYVIAVLDPEQMPMTGGDLPAAGIDPLCRPLDPRFLGRLLDEVGAEFQRGKEYADPYSDGPPLDQLGGLHGGSPIMLQVFQHMRRMAASDGSILLYGERGTGKARAARALHEAGRSASGSFLVVDARAAEPDRRMRALTTEATDPSGGFWSECLERARGGTLFVNHLPDISLQAQIPLLRALECPSVTRAAVSRPGRPARVIAAVDLDPLTAIRAGRLRQDLYDRLAHFVLRMPPLKERQHDLHGLSRLFLEELNQRFGTRKALSVEACEVMSRHHWPGNLAELKNVLEYAHTVSGEVILAENLPSAVCGGDAFANGETRQFRDIV